MVKPSATDRLQSTVMTFVRSGPLHLWTERFGDPAHPAVLLIMGAAAQGVTCPDALVDRLVTRGRQVIRFDHRDTGRSSSVDFDQNPYAIGDLAADCLAVLDAYNLPQAHLAGTSMGGVIAQWLAVHQPARVRSLTLIGTTPMGHHPELPPPTRRFRDHVAGQRGVTPGVESDVALFRVMNGDVLEFDEPSARATLERAWSRAIDPAAATNHFRAVRIVSPDCLVPLSTVTAPTTVVHGAEDPLNPLPHGEALAAAIPGAHLEVVPGMGHVFFSPGLPERLADLIAR
jgi:pimeloyl-ACP methyl ester carboxylesterase